MRSNIIAAAVGAYFASVAKANGVDSVSTTFAVDPAVQDKLEKAMQDSSAFLRAINVTGVVQNKGRSIGVGATQPIASRTDTTGSAERVPRPVHSLEADTYECVQTDFDTSIDYNTLDNWAHKPEFARFVAESIREAQLLDRLMIGWHGTSVAATTNRVANPMLQDVNKGWLQKLREWHVVAGKASQVMTEGATAGKILIGAGGDYGNLDSLVFDLIQGLRPWHRGRGDLVAVTSRELLHDKYLPIIDGADKNTEKLAAEVLAGSRNLGGLPAVAVPFFPPGRVLVTPLKNLSLYYQIEGRRRTLLDNPRKNQIENFESSNDAYVIEDFGAAMLAENIEAVETP